MASRWEKRKGALGRQPEGTEKSDCKKKKGEKHLVLARWSDALKNIIEMLDTAENPTHARTEVSSSSIN